MTDTAIRIEVATEIKFEDEEDHYVCCDIPDNFAGVTRTFCGQSIISDIQAAKGDHTGCVSCVQAASFDGCPLGHICKAVK